MKTLKRKTSDSCPRSEYAQAARSIAVVMFIGGLILSAPIRTWGQCDVVIPPQTPLNELWDHLYQPPWASPTPYPGTPGKLYRNGNQRPTGHNNEGVARGDGIVPIDGKIFMISIGLSNTNLEFAGSPDSFIPRAMNDDKSVNSPPLVLVNGAQSGIDAEEWATHIDETDPNCPWKILRDRLTGKGMTNTDQVQVAWIKLALEEPGQYGVFPAHADVLKGHLITVLQTLHTKYSNCKIAYFSTRTRAYAFTLDNQGLTHSPEPFAYEGGFGVKWVIEKQIDDHNNLSDGGDLNYDLSKGPVKAPWICWGPYFWTDGLTPRSDGLIWRCNLDVSQSDVQPQNSQGPDFVHPTANGIRKVTDQLLAFFKTDRTTKAWFRKVSTSPPTITISISPNDPTICAGDQVQFTASGPANIQDYNWNFDDGDCVIGSPVTKTFKVPGTYNVRLTGVLNDLDGNWATQTKQIIVSAPPCP